MCVDSSADLAFFSISFIVPCYVCVLEQLLARWIPQHILPIYDRQVDQVKTVWQNNAVNATLKTSLRSWLLRARRMYHAAGQSENWEKRCVPDSDLACIPSCVCLRVGVRACARAFESCRLRAPLLCCPLLIANPSNPSTIENDEDLRRDTTCLFSVGFSHYQECAWQVCGTDVDTATEERAHVSLG
jgi:hypothetical protein